MATSRTVALIPARAGSTRVQRKNLTKVGGRSLIGRSVDHARLLFVDSIVVFTDIQPSLLESDVINLVQSRSEKSATDGALADEYLQEFCEQIQADFQRVLLLQPTSPFRDIQLIIQALEAELKEGQILASGIASREQIWQRDALYWKPAFPGEPRRQQERPIRMVEDGSFYIFSPKEFINSGSLANLNWTFVENALPYSLDINDQSDIALADFYLNYFELS